MVCLISFHIHLFSFQRHTSRLRHLLCCSLMLQNCCVAFLPHVHPSVLPRRYSAPHRSAVSHRVYARRPKETPSGPSPGPVQGLNIVTYKSVTQSARTWITLFKLLPSLHCTGVEGLPCPHPGRRAQPPWPVFCPGTVVVLLLEIEGWVVIHLCSSIL